MIITLMPQHIGSDGFTTGIPGICPDCFADQTSFPHPEHYYCEHRERLAVKRDMGWETFRDVEVSDFG